MLKKVPLIVCWFFILPFFALSQQVDSLANVAGSSMVQDNSTVKDSVNSVIDSTAAVTSLALPKTFALQKLLQENTFLNSSRKPQNLIESVRVVKNENMLFYSLAILLFIFALLKFLYAKYFSNLFRVFFNTSLRQSQLTDQLLQAKLPSMLFNLFFVMIAGWYIYILLLHTGKSLHVFNWQALMVCIVGLTIVYAGKYSILKFTGWITGYNKEADTYIFVIFLINKIVGICLIPLVVIMTFSNPRIANVAVILSLVIIAVLMLMRFIRSYSLLQSKMQLGRFHFLIYIGGTEIIPLLVIYKLALLFVSKNL